MKIFDKDIFELIVDRVVIGEADENNNKDSRAIKFILKRGNEMKINISKKIL